MSAFEKIKLSYTAISTFDHCQFQYFLKYVDKNYSSSSSLALEIGTIAHKVKELISHDLMDGVHPDYEAYRAILFTGWTGADKSSGKVETIPGVDELKKKYWAEWCEPDTKSGLSYEDKIQIFCSNLGDEEADPVWHTIGVEVPFEFKLGATILHGFIDKVSMNANGELRVTDYKTSKQVYSDSDIKTPLQMVVYNLALAQMYPGHKIIESQYDFVFIGKTQLAGSVGWMKRGENKLQALIGKIQTNGGTGIWEAKPSPLCHYCDYCATKDNAEPSLSKLCPYYSLWLPDRKTFDVAKRWDGRKASVVVSETKTGKKKFVW